MSSESAELVVVGGGLAGLVAANRAAERGVRVLVLEKGSGPDYACNSRMTGGAFHMAMGAVDRDASEVLQILATAQHEGTDPALVTAVVSRGREVIDWLRAQGVKFIRGGPLAWQQWVLAPPNIPRAGYEWHGRSGDVCLRTLERALASRGGTLSTGMRARRLSMHEGAVTGVSGERADGSPFAIECRAVVLADGGFQGNPELVARYVTTHPDKLLRRGAGTGSGDGLTMALEAGALHVATPNFYGHLLAHEAAGNLKLSPFPFVDYLAVAGVLVNRSGARIADEGRGGVYLANTLAAMDDPSDAYVVFDAEIWAGPGRTRNNPANPDLERHGTTLAKSDSVRAIAERLGIDASGLEATIGAHNKAIASGTEEALAPPRSSLKGKPMPIVRAPFYGIRVAPGLTYTMGGIRVDRHCQVMSPTGAIRGLYAAGTTVGGLEGGRFVAYLGGLTRSAATGLIAAEHAAALVRGN